MTTKEILRVNLFPNARCVASGRQPDVQIDLQSIGWNTAGHNSISLVNENNVGAFACWYIPVTAGREYVFRCGIIYASETPARGYIVEIRDKDESGASLASIGNTKPSQSKQVLRFTAASDLVALIFRGAKDMAGKTGVEVWNPQLELASTFDAAVSGGGSSLLRLGHHAATIAGHVGRVVPDDVRQEPEPEPERDQTRRNLEPQRGARHREAERRRVVDLHVPIIRICRRPVQWFRSVLDSRIVVRLRDVLRPGRRRGVEGRIRPLRAEGRGHGRYLACAHDPGVGHGLAVLASAVHLPDPGHHTPARFVHGTGLAGTAIAGTRLVRRRPHAESLTAPVRGWSR